MIGDRNPFGVRTGRILHRLMQTGVCALLLWAGAVAAQDAPPRPPPAPGLFGAIGRWVDDTLSDVNSGVGNARGSLDDAAGRASDTARDAADAAGKIVRMPATSVVAGRQRCVAAPNQAPDCQAAADALCRDKGFKGGRSVDVQSAQKCPAQVWLSGRSPNAAECTLETYVTRAVCQ